MVMRQVKKDIFGRLGPGRGQTTTGPLPARVGYRFLPIIRKTIREKDCTW